MIALPVNTSLPQPHPGGKPHHHAHKPVPGFAGTLPRTTAGFEFRLRLTAIEGERRGEEVEARQRAQVTLSISAMNRGRGRLMLFNRGLAVARSVTIEITSAVEGKQTPFINGLEGLPVDLQPKQDMVLDVAVAMEDAELIKAVVRWTDLAGSQEATYTLRTM